MMKGVQYIRFLFPFGLFLDGMFPIIRFLMLTRLVENVCCTFSAIITPLVPPNTITFLLKNFSKFIQTFKCNCDLFEKFPTILVFQNEQLKINFRFLFFQNANSKNGGKPV